MIHQYKRWNPSPDSLAIVDQAVEILQEYEEDGFDLTLRQLYYQFVSRALIPNTQSSYSRLGNIVSNARDAGLLSWTQITDRGRSTYGIPSWHSTEAFLQQMAGRFHRDPWDSQPSRVQVWVEKDALSSVVARACNPLRVDYFPNKGYVSSSSIWRSARCMAESGVEDWTILHLGDHDPSGIDMSRDIQERLSLYGERIPYHDDDVDVPMDIKVKRIALTRDQVSRYDPPPNPAKVTDSRFESYQKLYGNESWELDALDPATIVGLIQSEIGMLICDHDAFDSILQLEAEEQSQIRELQVN